MLPGFRFLFAAVVLSLSTLVFGVGAAALLRSAHEEFVTLPSRRPPPETVFAQRFDSVMPTLALLRIDTPAPVAAGSEPSLTPEASVSAAPEPTTPIPSPGVEVDKLGAPAAAWSPEPTPQNVEAPSEAPAQTETKADTATPAAPVEQQKSEAPNAAVRIAALAEPPPAASQPSPAEPPPAMPSDDGARAAARKIAVLGGPEVTIEPTAAPGDASPDKSVTPAKQAQKPRGKRRRVVRSRPAPPKHDVLGLFDPMPQPGQPTIRRN